MLWYDNIINECEYLSIKENKDEEDLISSNTYLAGKKQNSNKKIAENKIDDMINSECIIKDPGHHYITYKSEN